MRLRHIPLDPERVEAFARAVKDALLRLLRKAVVDSVADEKLRSDGDVLSAECRLEREAADAVE